MKKKITLFSLLLLLFLAVSGLWLIQRGFSVSIGQCLVADNGSVLLMKDGPIRMSDRSLFGSLFDNLTDGDRILVLHDSIAESYPAQTGAHFLLRLGSGSRADMSSAHLQQLTELGWLSPADDHPAQPTAPDSPTPPSEPERYAFDAQYIRTNGYHEDAEYPRTVVIHTRRELDSYYEENRERYDLSRKEVVYSDTTIGFPDACDRYDDAYFAEHDLLLILLEEGSGSIRHQVTDIRCNGAEWVISIRRITPEIGTDDMAQWHIMAEVQMGKVFSGDTPIRVEFVK